MVRIVSHAAVWVSVLVALDVELDHGWRPVGDSAAIAARAYETFTSHPPLVGMVSTGGAPGHTIYDPGPLLFWLLAVPVRVDAVQGVLWGAALLTGVILSLSIEAIWRAQLWAGCAVIALVTVDLFWLTPAVLENISWNAYLPIPFFVASLAFAWLVGAGRFGWWPVLVFTASVAAQSHLLFAIPCAALALLAPVVALLAAGRPTRLRWLWSGIGVGVACWIAPVLQQLFGARGNMSALVTSQSGGATFGGRFALSLLGRVAVPSPVWLVHQPTTAGGLVRFETAATATSGIIVLALLCAVGAWAWRSRRGPLLAAAATCLVASVATIATYAIFPTKNAVNLYYLLDLLWPLGIVLWATVGWGVVTAVGDVVGHRRTAGAETAAADGTDLRAAGRLRDVGAVVGVAAVVVLGVLGVSEASGFVPRENTVAWDKADAATVTNVSRAVERVVPAGPVVVSITNPPGRVLSGIWVTEGVAWNLRADGWSPGLFSFEANYTGLTLPKGTPFTAVTITMDGTEVATVTHAHCRIGYLSCDPPITSTT
jgi:hypothetical protein